MVKKLTPNLAELTSGLEKLGNFLKNFDLLGAFAIGAYNANPTAPHAHKVMRGFRSLLYYKMAQSPNIPTSAVGISAIGLEIGQAYSKSFAGAKKDYELNGR